MSMEFKEEYRGKWVLRAEDGAARVKVASLYEDGGYFMRMCVGSSQEDEAIEAGDMEKAAELFYDRVRDALEDERSWYTELLEQLAMLRDGAPYEEPSGKWITDRVSGVTYCSACGTVQGKNYHNWYCSACGTRMEDE